MALRIRRGVDAQRSSRTFDQGEIVWTTDTRRLWVGDGITQGGIPVVDPASFIGFGLEVNNDPESPDYGRIEVGGDLTTDYVPQGTNNKYFSAVLAQEAAAELFVTGDHSNISFVYDEELGSISASVSLDGVGLTDVSADTSPQLGGNLDLNLSDITGTGDINIIGSIEASGSITAADGEVTGTLTAGGLVVPVITAEGPTFSIGTTASPIDDFVVNLAENFQIRQFLNEGSSGYVSSTLSRGSLTAPAAVQAGDGLGGFVMRAYTSSSNIGTVGALEFLVDDTAVIAGGNFVKSKAVISASSDTSSDLEDALVLDSDGTVTANAFEASKYFQMPVYADDTARSTAIPAPAAGMMVFMTSGTVPTVTNKPVIYNGSAWEAF
jgi:hypothetical protein